KSQAPVFITGDSGSGKELAARMIHLGGPRAEQPFVPVNCGAIPENLMESEFFGYRKGAFTGAEGDRDGFFQAANGGTLFLDEVADLPLPMQVKLLRVIQEKRVRKVGSTTEEPVDVRIISATHKKLASLVDAGEFRQDLFYRLHVIELAMPSLREMREDIPKIAEAILTKLSRATPAKLDPEAVTALESYPFPGNVRELENILERGLSLAADPQRITAADLHLTPVASEIDSPVPAGEKWPLQDYLDRVERVAINEALEKTRYNRTAAAKPLGIGSLRWAVFPIARSDEGDHRVQVVEGAEAVADMRGPGGGEFVPARAGVDALQFDSPQQRRGIDHVGDLARLIGAHTRVVK